MNIPEANGAKLAAVPDFPGYVVSDQGEVYCNLGFHPHIKKFEDKYRLIKGGKARDNRRVVSLSKDGRVVYKQVHTLVLESFIGPCPPGLEGCHNDGDHTNNKLENLRWGTRASNAKDRLKHGKFDPKKSKQRLTENDVIEILKRLDNNELQDKIAKDYQVTQALINKINRGENWRKLQIKLGRKVPAIRTRAAVKVKYRAKLIEKYQREILETQDLLCNHEWLVLESLGGLHDKQCSICGKFDLSLGI